MVDIEVRDVVLSGGVRLQVEEAGSGPALLLMHAGIADRHMWDPQWDWLAQRFRTVRWDFRGFGDTPHVAGPFSYSGDVLRIMDALGIAQATLMGCSFAGSVAIKVAVEQPERVERLVLVGSGLPGHEANNPPGVEDLFARVDAAFAREDVAEAFSLLEQLWLVGPSRRPDEVDAGYLARGRQLLARTNRPDNGAQSLDRDWSAAGRLEHLHMPVLVLVGDQDVPHVVEIGRELQRRLPVARLRIIEHAAHLPNLERTQLFDDILKDWLAETGGMSRHP